MAAPCLRVLLAGASGNLRGVVAGELGQRPEIISAGRSSAEVRTDLTGAYGPNLHGFEPKLEAPTALACRRRVEGARTGQVCTVP
ncbi:MAG: hypothetical protein ABI178_15950 [Rhodanobacter sp.]